MTETIAGMTRWELEFDQTGQLRGDEGLLGGAAPAELRDLFVFSHGWNNSFDSARSLYREMMTLISALLSPEQRATTAFAGVLWPSILFPEDSPGLAATNEGKELTAALAPAFPGKEADLARLGELLDERRQDSDRLREFHALATGLVTSPAQAPEDSGEQRLLTEPPLDVMEAFARSAEGDTQGFNPFDRLWRGAKDVLRTLSYYEMKNRAGAIGKAGLSPALVRLKETAPELRVHLIGHSFGARLVSYGLAGLPANLSGAQSPVKSLLLIQAAFSHFTFAPRMPIDVTRAGALAKVADRVDGPLLSTFTVHDRAVGLFYPNASRLSREDNQSENDFNFRWGGLGHDGFQQDDVTDVPLRTPRTPYALETGRFYRLDANQVIRADQSVFSGAHSDIRHPEVAWAAVAAAGLG